MSSKYVKTIVNAVKSREKNKNFLVPSPVVAICFLHHRRLLSPGHFDLVALFFANLQASSHAGTAWP